MVCFGIEDNEWTLILEEEYKVEEAAEVQDTPVEYSRQRDEAETSCVLLISPLLLDHVCGLSLLRRR